MGDLLNSGDRLGQLDRLVEFKWWNGQIGSDTVKADIRVHYLIGHAVSIGNDDGFSWYNHRELKIIILNEILD